MDRFQCLDKAAEAVTARQTSYGAPEDNASRIAAYWSVVVGIDIHPWQVALMMGHVKDARLLEDPGHVDSWVDKAGYAAYGAEIATESDQEAGLAFPINKVAS